MAHSVTRSGVVAPPAASMAGVSTARAAIPHKAGMRKRHTKKKAVRV